MYTQEEYLYGWLAYLLGAALLVLCTWMITRRVRPGGLRYLLRFLVAVTLVVPWYIAADSHYLAPAWVIAAFEGIFDGDFWRAGGPLLTALGAALIVGVIGWILQAWLTRRA